MMAISFVIPALNEEKLIGNCIRSISREIEAYGVNGEIIVVDNASTDNTTKVALESGANFVVLEGRRGILYAKQAGLSCASYDLIAFIDADCTLRRGWMRRVIKDFAAPEVLAVSGPYRYHDVSRLGRLAADTVFSVYGLVSHFMAMMMGGNSVLRRDVLWAFGGLNNPAITFWGDDTWIAIQVAKLGKRPKFDLRMTVNSSGRRLIADGYLKTFARYIKNDFAIRMRGEPATVGHREVR